MDPGPAEGTLTGMNDELRVNLIQRAGRFLSSHL